MKKGLYQCQGDKEIQSVVIKKLLEDTLEWFLSWYLER